MPAVPARAHAVWKALAIASALLLVGCERAASPAQAAPSDPAGRALLSSPRGAVAIFAGGCFWCVEADFEKLDGVIEVESGYAGGDTPNPSYEAVSSGRTGHTEAVRIIYDPQKVSYAKLLDHLWRNIDPTVKNQQFCDVGSQYRSAIFWQTDAERQAAEASRDTLLKSGKFPDIHTQIVPAKGFWMAEDYHQDYAAKNPVRYNYYRYGCGRDARLKRLWGEP